MTPTRRRLATLAFASLGAAGLVRGWPAAARGRPEDDLPNVFFSPHGRPYRAAPGAPYPVVDWFAEADRNGDGKIDRDEFLADAAAFFAVLDLDGDGVLRADEIALYEHQIAPEIIGQRVTVYGAVGPLRAPDRDAARLWRVQLPSPYSPQYGPQSGPTQEGPSAPGGPGQAEIGPPDEIVPRDARPNAPGTGQPDLDREAGASLFSLLDTPEPVTAADPDFTFSGAVRKSSFLSYAQRNFSALDAGGKGYLTLAGLPKTPVQKMIELARR